MQLLDWILVAGSLLLVVGIGLYTQRYMKSVADFMSAGRVARRYLLAVAKGEMQAGAVVFVASFELISQSGFTNAWWSWLLAPISLLVTIVGFVVYRYRETRAMTLGQFFELRYSKAFRLFAGGLGFLAGLLNFGIIPAVGARFLVYFLGLPAQLHVFGMTLPTFIPLMGLFLTINLFITLTGGLITIMMTNCAEGIVSQVLYLALIFGLLWMFSWPEISSVLERQPAQQSLLNPMDSMGLKDFNVWYVIMNFLVYIYGTMAWQNQSSYQSAPLTAHEGRMGGILGRWRELGKLAVITLLAVCAMTYLHHPHFAAGATLVRADLAKISNPQTQEQMTIPITVIHLLPTGLKGALCAILLLGIFGGDSTHLHSWGSLFIQDVILPLRKKPLAPEQHIRLLRLSMTGVAVFAFIFGSLFPPTDYIYMWWNVTTSIYVAGAGAAIIGGLYWKKGTTAGAWAGALTGSLLSLAGIVARLIDPDFFLNGTQIFFFAALLALTTYVIASLLTCRENFNLERMLHRGAYAAIGAELGDRMAQAKTRRITWGKIIGYDEDFTLGDKWVAGGLFAWTLLFCLIAIIGTIWNLISPWSAGVWSEFWHVVSIIIPVVMAVVIGVWFTWGGVMDTIDLFRRLRQEKVNPLDNGAVVDHQNLDESVLPGAASSLSGKTTEKTGLSPANK
jgi:SSS family solute:Na+ symporter